MFWKKQMFELLYLLQMETEYIAYICEKCLTCFLITDAGLIYKTDLCWTGAHLIAKITKTKMLFVHITTQWNQPHWTT